MLLADRSNVEQFTAAIKAEMKQCDETCVAAVY